MTCHNHLEVSEGIRRCARCQTPFCPDCLVEIQGRPYCAGCKTEYLLDIRSGVNPGGLNYTRFWRRFGGLFLDKLVVSLPSYLLLILLPTLAMSGKSGEPNLWAALFWIPYIFVQPCYEALMTQFKNGQTLGKMAMRIRIVRPDGSPISAGQAWGRSFMRLVLGCASPVGYIPYFFTPEKTTIHDMVAGTRVVEAD